MKKDEKNARLKSMFLGPKAENSKLFIDLITEVIVDHVYWRKNFHPEDDYCIQEEIKRHPVYEQTLMDLRKHLFDMLSKLKSDVPFFSPRYIGHMTSDLLMPGIIGYIASLLYNPNNVTSEAAPFTTQCELQAGQQLARMMGYDSTKSWGHITSGGTVANIEGLWVARNLKFLPLAIAELFLENKDYNEIAKKVKINYKNKAWTFHDILKIKKIEERTWILLNIPVEEIFSLRENITRHISSKKFDEDLKNYTISDIGLHKYSEILQNIKIIIPRTKHYSWVKSVELLGLGRNSIEYIDIEPSSYNIDAEKLEKCIDTLNQNKIPVLCLVSVLGSTEEGSLDPLDKIYEIKNKYSELGMNFHWHLDAAWGGYIRSVIVNQDNDYSSDLLDSICEDIKKITQITQDVNYLHEWKDSFLQCLKYTGKCDSITIDPHKLGFIPYPAGAILFKNKKIKTVISCHAPYIFFDDAKKKDVFIGRFILEGSKPGAAAAAVWLTHKILSLDNKGYGLLIGETIKNAHILYLALKKFNYKNYEIIPVFKPQSNLVCFVVNQHGNKKLSNLNAITLAIYNELSFKIATSYADLVPSKIAKSDFFVSKTKFSPEEYGDEVITNIAKICEVEQDTNQIEIIRMTIMDPFLMDKQKEGQTYLEGFLNALKMAIDTLIKKQDITKYYTGIERVQYSSFALIKNNKYCLLMYNKKWGNINFIGGKRGKQDENKPLKTIKREISEELFRKENLPPEISFKHVKDLKRLAESKRNKDFAEYNFSFYLLKYSGSLEEFISILKPREHEQLYWLDVSSQSQNIFDTEMKQVEGIISQLIPYVFNKPENEGSESKTLKPLIDWNSLEDSFQK